MKDFFLEGGVGMFPTVLFGFIALAFAARDAMRRGPRGSLIIAFLLALTASCAVLGFSVGLIATVSAVQSLPDSTWKLFAQGLSESTNNLVLGSLLVVPAALLAAVGAFRAPRA
jgi:hypothetical protein